MILSVMVAPRYHVSADMAFRYEKHNLSGSTDELRNTPSSTRVTGIYEDKEIAQDLGSQAHHCRDAPCGFDPPRRWWGAAALYPQPSMGYPTSILRKLFQPIPLE